jgi:hypothetical protein
VSYVDDARELSWYCQECVDSELPGPACHPIGAHIEGVSWPIRLETDKPPPRRCWCGRSLPSIGPICHDPYDIYKCRCGLHLFATRERVSPGAWAYHLNHMAAFANDDWALGALAVLTEHGLVDGRDSDD